MCHHSSDDLLCCVVLFSFLSLLYHIPDEKKDGCVYGICKKKRELVAVKKKRNMRVHVRPFTPSSQQLFASSSSSSLPATRTHVGVSIAAGPAAADGGGGSGGGAPNRRGAGGSG